jgi:hypothetical protein
VKSFSPIPKPKARGRPLVGSLRLPIQYIRRYPPYLEAVSSIRNLRTTHAVVTRDTLSIRKIQFECVSLLSLLLTCNLR